MRKMSQRKAPLSDRGMRGVPGSNRGIEMREEKIKRRLKELNTAENTIVRSLRGTLQLETFQRTPEIKPRFERLRKQRDQRKQREATSLARIQALFKASPQQLTEARQDDILQPQLFEVNQELMRWLAKHPEAMRELSPRKFEEFIAEIFHDQGHAVQLTKATRDGGRDIIVVMKTVIGELLALVECKRLLPPYKVGLGVIERFLHVIRQKDKANIGIIASTTSFSPDARKSAQEYKYQLKLADFDQLKEMAKHYGSWHRTEGSQIWMPNYVVV